MNSGKPKAVGDVEAFWLNPPPQPSARCEWWKARIEAGWRRNRRLSGMNYYTSAEWFGVYIWEWINVLLPALQREKGPSERTLRINGISGVDGDVTKEAELSICCLNANLSYDVTTGAIKSECKEHGTKTAEPKKD